MRTIIIWATCEEWGKLGFAVDGGKMFHNIYPPGERSFSPSQIGVEFALSGEPVKVVRHLLPDIPTELEGSDSPPLSIEEAITNLQTYKLEWCTGSVSVRQGKVVAMKRWPHLEHDYPQTVGCNTCSGYRAYNGLQTICPICRSEFCSCDEEELPEAAEYVRELLTQLVNE